ncbi:hypothetical protein LWI29_009407 [Acer saccharum]|uniref:Chromo domain-containing protein n=1 Tax=Acer saccharum TaxID=4024 RepID=A0AA39S176_ACESA|nr:hypothetical protein LWI29_009407 [Acer saccharum]
MRDEILTELRHNLELARNRMKIQADKHCREVIFNVGDYVLLLLQPYRQQTMVFRRSLKLSPRYFGSYKVTERVRPVAYRLELPVGSLIHDVFHVSLLKPHFGSLPTSLQLPPLTDVHTILPQPESILDSRVIKRGNYRSKEEILVKWVGAPAEDATWENKRRLLHTYPTFNP